MLTVVVVDDRRHWAPQISGVEVVVAKEYLTDPRWVKARAVRVFNLCGSYRYQSAGYYVSLLAVARRHRPFPDLRTVLDMRSRAIVRTADEELDELIQKSLATLRSDRFELSVYFGRNLAKRYERLATRLFGMFHAPLLRAQFVRHERWRLASVSPIAAKDVPDKHGPFVFEAAREYFARPRYRARKRKLPRYHMALLHDPHEEFAPSDEKALRRFERAAEEVGFGVERIGKEDYARIPEFDALFLRETTYVNHHTFRFAQRAEAEGLVVIDDPESILRCTNKVYLSEALQARGIPTPRTLVLDTDDPREVLDQIGLPCVLKHPDSSFSQGVTRCTTEEELREEARRILARSDLYLAQEFFPSSFDWRVGVLDGEPLYACRYHMARGHWQIVRKTSSGRLRFGKVETLPVEDAPGRVVRAAVRAALAVGNGLYGVDLKESGRKVAVIEVNDNPSLDAGYEDAVLKRELWQRIARKFLERVEARKEES